MGAAFFVRSFLCPAEGVTACERRGSQSKESVLTRSFSPLLLPAPSSPLHRTVITPSRRPATLDATNSEFEASKNVVFLTISVPDLSEDYTLTIEGDHIAFKGQSVAAGGAGSAATVAAKSCQFILSLYTLCCTAVYHAVATVQEKHLV